MAGRHLANVLGFVNTRGARATIAHFHPRATSALQMHVVASRPLHNCQVRSFADAPSVSLVKELRQLSGAPIMDCKKALMAEDVDGDLDKAFEWLRKKGATAAKEKAGRVTEQGLVGVSIGNDKRSGCIVEVNSETDFVAKNDLFQRLVQDVSASLIPMEVSGTSNITLSDSEALEQVVWNDKGKTVEQAVTDVVGVVRESIKLRRAATITLEHGVIGLYMHNSVKPLSNAEFGSKDEATYGLGQVGCLVALSTPSSIAEDASLVSDLEMVAKRLAMHIVAASPRCLSRDDVPEEALSKEKELLTTMALESGKNPEVAERMVQGRLGKFYEQICLLEQKHMVEEGSPKIQKFMDSLKERIGVDVSIESFVHFHCGKDDNAPEESSE